MNPIDLSHDDAQELTTRIRASVQELWPLLVEAFQRRAWVALGYESWNAYCDTELRGMRPAIDRTERQAHALEMRQAGMSLPAIASALGVSLGTAHADTQAFSSESLPTEIQGADGKTYASTRPTSTPSGPSVPSASATDEDRTGPNLPLAPGEAHVGLDVPQEAAVREAPDGMAVPSGAGETAAAAWSTAAADGSDDGGSPTATASHGPADVHADPARPGPVEGSPGPGRVTPEHDPDEFAAALDRLVPDDNPHREWQRRFLDTIAGTYKITRFTPEDVAERADEQLIGELIRAIDSLADYRDRVVKAHLLGIPNNVTPIRRIS